MEAVVIITLNYPVNPLIPKSRFRQIAVGSRYLLEPPQPDAA